MIKPLTEATLLPSSVFPSSVALPSRFPVLPKEPAQMSQFLQQVSQALATHSIGAAVDEDSAEAELQLFVCWALEQSCSGKFTQDDSLQLLDLAWQVQKRLWAARSSWILRCQPRQVLA